MTKTLHDLHHDPCFVLSKSLSSVSHALDVDKATAAAAAAGKGGRGISQNRRSSKDRRRRSSSTGAGAGASMIKSTQHVDIIKWFSDALRAECQVDFYSAPFNHPWQQRQRRRQCTIDDTVVVPSSSSNSSGNSAKTTHYQKLLLNKGALFTIVALLNNCVGT